MAAAWHEGTPHAIRRQSSHPRGDPEVSVLPEPSVPEARIIEERGNGFLFEHFDAQSLRWAMDQAMAFYALPDT